MLFIYYLLLIRLRYFTILPFGNDFQFVHGIEKFGSLSCITNRASAISIKKNFIESSAL